MALDEKQAASTRRILMRTLFLTLPLVLGAIRSPRASRPPAAAPTRS